MTRGGIDALRDQLWAETSRHGLGRATDVLIVADGAIWIWNLANDRFPQARRRLDAYHAKQHLWAVAEALHGAGTPAARAWVEPLFAQLDRSEAPQVIADLRALLHSPDQARPETVQREINDLNSHCHRMDCAEGQQRGEPVGSGAMESTCQRYQCRFKRPVNFGPKPATKPCSTWKPSGATAAGTASSLTSATSTLPKTEMAPLVLE